MAFYFSLQNDSRGVCLQIVSLFRLFRSLCRVSPVQIQDEGDWRCTIKSKKHRSDETVCGLVIYVPKSYRIPTFLEELEAKVGIRESTNTAITSSSSSQVSKDGTVALECKVIGVPTPKLLWFKDDKELNAGDSYELRAENNKPTTTYKCVAVNCIGSAMSETILKITSSANTAPPKLLVGMNDIKVKIGSDIEFFVKGTHVKLAKVKYSCDIIQSMRMHFLVKLNGFTITRLWFPRQKGLWLKKPTYSNFN